MLFRLLIILFSTLAICGCQTKADLSRVSSTGAVIFVPGYKGTSLVDLKTGKPVWLSVREILFQNRSLYLPHPALESTESLELQAGEVLREIPVIPGIYRYPVYEDTLRTIQDALPKHNIATLAYDWRDNLHNAVIGLHRLVQKEREESGNPVTIIAHSMGGLIASYYLRYGTQKPGEILNEWTHSSDIALLVTAGTPFLGVVGIIEDMERGEKTGINSHLMNAKAVSSFNSAYYLLPRFADSIVNCQGNETLVSRTPVLNTFLDSNWGLMGTHFGEYTREVRESVFLDLYHEGDDYMNALHDNHLEVESFPVKTKMINLTGHTGLAYERAVYSGELKSYLFHPSELSRFNCENHSISGPGDGVVHVKSSQVPEPFKSLIKTEIQTTRQHGELLLDGEFLRLLKQVSGY